MMQTIHQIQIVERMTEKYGIASYLYHLAVFLLLLRWQTNTIWNRAGGHLLEMTLSILIMIMKCMSSLDLMLFNCKTMLSLTVQEERCFDVLRWAITNVIFFMKYSNINITTSREDISDFRDSLLTETFQILSKPSQRTRMLQWHISEPIVHSALVSVRY